MCGVGVCEGKSVLQLLSELHSRSGLQLLSEVWASLGLGVLAWTNPGC